MLPERQDVFPATSSIVSAREHTVQGWQLCQSWTNEPRRQKSVGRRAVSPREVLSRCFMPHYQHFARPHARQQLQPHQSGHLGEQVWQRSLDERGPAPA